MRACVPVSVVLALALTLGGAGCTARAADMQHVSLTDDELADASQTEAGGWQSAPWSRTRWLSFPGRTAVEIEHPLGRKPDSVIVYLSFVGDDRKGNERTSFLGAGDTAHIYAVTDTTITVENTTAADFYLRVVLQ